MRTHFSTKFLYANNMDFSLNQLSKNLKYNGISKHFLSESHVPNTCLQKPSRGMCVV